MELQVVAENVILSWLLCVELQLCGANVSELVDKLSDQSLVLVCLRFIRRKRHERVVSNLAEQVR